MGGDSKTPAGISADDLEKLDARYVTYPKLLGWTGGIVAAGAGLILTALSLMPDYATQRDVERVLEDVREVREHLIGIRTALDTRQEPAIQDSGNATVTVGKLDELDRKPWLSVSEYAQVMGVHTETVDRWRRSGKLGEMQGTCRKSPLTGKWEYRNPRHATPLPPDGNNVATPPEPDE